MPTESIRDVAAALRTVDPAEPDDSDLAVLCEVICDDWVRYWNTTHEPRHPPRPGGLLRHGRPRLVRHPPGPGSPPASRGIAELIARAAAAGDDVALRRARGAQHVVEFLSHGLYPGPGRNLRNEVMAESLRWILDREHRIVVGAHNVHVQRSPLFDGTAPLGALLGPVLGDDLVVIGTTRAAGTLPEPPDLDADPDQCFVTPAGQCLPLHLVDLRRTPPAILAGTTAMSAQNLLIDLDPRQAFDAVIHVRNVIPVHRLG